MKINEDLSHLEINLAERLDSQIGMETPSYQNINESKRFFAQNSEGDRFPIFFHKGMVIITTAYGTKVVFTKTNRSNFFKDSRDGKMLSEIEVKSELTRLLDSKEKAEEAFLSLVS